MAVKNAALSAGFKKFANRATKAGGGAGGAYQATGEGFFGRAGAMGKMATHNLKSSFGEGAGWGTVARGMGGHMVRGAVAGGAIGGTIEAAQGGSFWSGAKEGAWNGAVGWGAWRAAGRATGATTRNPIRALGQGGVVNSAAKMWKSTNGGISKPAASIISQSQGTKVARRAMNGGNKVSF